MMVQIQSQQVRPGDLIIRHYFDKQNHLIDGTMLVIAISSRVDDQNLVLGPAEPETIYEFTVLVSGRLTKCIRFEHTDVTCIKGS